MECPRCQYKLAALPRARVPAMLDWLVGVAERPRLAGDPATRRGALRKAYWPFRLGDRARVELGP